MIDEIWSKISNIYKWQYPRKGLISNIFQSILHETNQFTPRRIQTKKKKPGTFIFTTKLVYCEWSIVWLTLCIVKFCDGLPFGIVIKLERKSSFIFNQIKSSIWVDTRKIDQIFFGEPEKVTQTHAHTLWQFVYCSSTVHTSSCRRTVCRLRIQ